MPTAPLPAEPWLTPPVALRALGVALGSCILVASIILITRATTGIAVLWPLNGLMVGLCLLVPMRHAQVYLSAFFVGNVAAGLLTGDPWGLAWGLPVANVVEILIAWLPLRGLVRQHPNLGHPNVLWAFTSRSIFVAPAISGVLASIIVMLSLDVPLWHTFRVWWPGNALGMTVFAPLTVAFRPAVWRQGGGVEGGVLRRGLIRSGVLAGLTLLVFLWKPLPFFFILLPPAVWVAFGLGFPGAILGALIVMAIGFPLTFLGYGPATLVPGADMVHRFLILQAFLGVILLTTLPIGMILDHRTRLIARLRQREVDLSWLAHHDPLTSLLNRRGFEVQFAQSLSPQHQRPMSVAVLDVDWFKRYNDTYGHPAGDECLVWLAQLLSEHAQAVGGIASRQGGEEFGVFLPGVSVDQAMVWAEKLRQAVVLAARPHVGSPMGVVSISIGVAGRTGSGRADDRSVLLDADRALYDAKDHGRNRVCRAIAPPRAGQDSATS